MLLDCYITYCGNQHNARRELNALQEDQPFMKLLDDNIATERYLASCDGASQGVMKLDPTVVGPVGAAVVAHLLLGPLGMLGAMAFWKFSDFGAAERPSVHRA